MTERTHHLLCGLRPEPLASYLAGLGLIRLLAEQADPAASAAWEPGGLAIDTTVGTIGRWLADSYVPSPILSPWNSGSGFGEKDVTPKEVLAEIQRHPSPRLAPLREAIATAAAMAAHQEANGWDKARAVQEYRNRCPEKALPWIDACVVLADQQTYFPPLLGTGGNDGRFDFSTNFHQRLLEVLGPEDKAHARSMALAGDLLSGQSAERLVEAPVGQFDPASAGGPGSSRFGAAASMVNPWAFILLIEGSLLFAASPARRLQHAAGRAAIPFTVSSSPDGSASGADGEESRGEIWVPVWTQPYTLTEVRQLFIEARASWHGQSARRSVDFYAATRTLGVARGLDAFVRYGLQQRNGLAYAAVPVDRVSVRENPAVRLIADVQDWPSWLGSEQSAAVRQAVRQFERAQLAYVKEGKPADLRRLLAALTTLELAAGRSGRARDKVPVRRPPRAAAFLAEFQRGQTPELRIAAGIASCATKPGAGPSRAMRQLLLPVDPPAPADRARSAGRWRETPVIPGFGSRPLVQVLADVLAWRLRTTADEPGAADFRGARTFTNGVFVPAADLHCWALGRLDDAAIDEWLRAVLALDWSGVTADWQNSSPPVMVSTLGLLHPFAAGLSPARGDGPGLALQPDWPSQLSAGQVRQVHAETVTRMRQAGWNAVPPPACPPDGARIAAALVPRALGWRSVLPRLARPLRPEADDHEQPVDTNADIDEFSSTPEEAEELS